MRSSAQTFTKLLLAGALVIGGISVANAHDDDDHDSGDRITKTYDLTGFDAIDISGVYDVEVKVGGSYSIRLEGREKEMDYAEVELDGDTLELGQRKKKWGWGNRKSVDAYITLPSLNALDVSGVTDADVENIDADTFELDVSGVADVNLSGTCDELDADISGVSDVNARELKCKSGDVDLSGVGDLEVYTSEAIDASVHGVGDVTVYGSPADVEKSVSKYTASLTIK